jgi:AcrR family transcriptional regulator
VSPDSDGRGRGTDASPEAPPPTPALSDGDAAGPAAASPREARRAQRLATRRGEVLAVAARLFATHGYDGTSLERIASGAGYSVGAIYTFFPSKDAVYAAVLHRNASALADRLRGCAAPTGLDTLLTMASTVVHQARRFPDHARLIRGALAPERDRSARDASTGPILQVYAAAIRTGQRDGTVRDGQPELLAYYVGGLVSAHIAVDQEAAGYPRGVSIDDFLDLLRGALRRRPTT